MKSSLANNGIGLLPTHLIILSDKIKLIYVISRKLSLSLYELTDEVHEMIASLREVIFHPVERPPRLAGRFFTL